MSRSQLARLSVLQSYSEIFDPPNTGSKKGVSHLIMIVSCILYWYRHCQSDTCSHVSPLFYTTVNSIQYGYSEFTNLRRFWAYLKSDNRPKEETFVNPSLLRVIQLPQNLRWPVGLYVNSTLFVRPSQDEVIEKVFNQYLQRLNPDFVLDRESGYRPVTGSSRFGFADLILGPPGIGKSALLNYFIYLASAYDVDVVLQRGCESLHMLHKDGYVSQYKVPEIRSMDELDSPKTLYLFDPDLEYTQANICAAYTIIPSVPDERHYSKHLLAAVRATRVKSWTRDELLLAHQALEPNHILPDEKRAEIERRFEQVVWSMRPETTYAFMLQRRSDDAEKI